MDDVSRESELSAAFVALADTLATGYDISALLDTLLHDCTRILDASAGVLLLKEPSDGRVSLAASTSERADFIDMVQLDVGNGPCIDCLVSGTAITVADIDKDRARWPVFAAAALTNGYRSMQATPLRLRTETIGAMNLFSTHPGGLNPRDTAAAQALADVATIGILQQRNIHDTTIVSENLQRALDSRILIEQAKGVLSEGASIDMDQAFATLRSHARNNQLSLQTVAQGVVDRTLTLSVDARVLTYNPSC